MTETKVVADQQQTPFNLTMYFLTEYSATHNHVDYALATKVFHIPKLVSSKFGGYKYTPQESQLVSRIQYKMLAKATLHVARNKPATHQTEQENAKLHKKQVVDTFSKRYKILARFFKIPFEQINKHLEKDLIHWVIETCQDRLFIGYEFADKAVLLEDISDALLLIGIFEKASGLLETMHPDKTHLDYLSQKKQLWKTISHLTHCLLDPAMSRNIPENATKAMQKSQKMLERQIEAVNTLFVEKYSETMQLKSEAEYKLYNNAAQKFFNEKRELFDQAKKQMDLQLTKKEKDTEIRTYTGDISSFTLLWEEVLRKINGLRRLLFYGHRKLASSEVTSIIEMNNQYIYPNGFINELFSTRDFFTLRLKELLEDSDSKYDRNLLTSLKEFFNTLKTLASQNKISIEARKRKKLESIWLMLLDLFSLKRLSHDYLTEYNSRETNLKLAAYSKLVELTYELDKRKLTREDRLVDIAILSAERSCARKDFMKDIEELVEQAQKITEYGKRKPYAEMLFKYIMREGKSWSPFLTMAIMFEYKEVLDSLPSKEIHESINGRNGEWMLILRDIVVKRKLTSKKHIKNLLKLSK
ncbi:MAG: hypothetical protein HN945_21355 [Deltaproteobacteria bacterium]|nr:hypothetical protein [Deltaproteobacteria bacterium]MBT7154996.1 hypothetical protein [Deltaproteobacteria bacterium]